MATDTGAADSGQAASRAPEPTHIHVHIHQESALAKLLLTGCSLLQLPATATSTTSQTSGGSRLLGASWVAQIALGLLSGILGGFLYILRCHTVCSSGAALWTGAVAVLAGAAAFVYEKKGGTCWAILRTLLSLAAFCTAIAAIAVGADNFHVYLYSWEMDGHNICRDSSSDWRGTPPGTLSPAPEEKRLCISQANMLQSLSLCLHSMLLGVWVLLLLASLAPLCLYFWKRLFTEEKRDQKKLLGANEFQPCLC